MAANGYGGLDEQAREIMDELEANPHYEVPGWLSADELKAVIDPEKPLSVNLSRVADDLL